MNAIRATLIWQLFLLLAGGACAAPASSGPPGAAPSPGRVTNARVEAAPSSANLEAAIREAAKRGADPVWIGYSVPMVAGMGKVCCLFDYKSKDDDPLCRLEEKNYGWSTGRKIPRADQPLHVFVRAKGGRVNEVQGYSEDCRIDLGGRRFVWLGEARPEQSAAFLEGLAGLSVTEEDGKHRAPGDQSLALLSLHRGEAADSVLERLASPSTPYNLRQSALFWMGQTRGERGARFLAKVIEEDANDQVRDHAIFSLSQSEAPWADAAILKVARTDRSPHIRGQALFWLAQTGAPGAEAAVLQAIEKDPAPQVRSHAVFVLSQLKDGKATPALVELAKRSRDAEVRKQAYFWLGQSKDPAALAYLDQALND